MKKKCRSHVEYIYLNNNKRKKRAGGIFGGDGYVYYLDCNDRVTGLVICQNSSKGTQSFKHMQFFCISITPQ